MITTKKWQQLRQRMQLLNISEDDLQEKFIIGSGKGGQNLHKTASCISLLHSSTGIVIKCQQSRSRESNRFHARRLLCDKVDLLIFQERSEQQQAIDKIRRQKKRRSMKAKQKILKQKHLRSEVKIKRRKLSYRDE
jgi:protein subunit release factor B